VLPVTKNNWQMYTNSNPRPNHHKKKVAVIGAGIGGLASACLLASDGADVTVIEKNAQAGGKMNQLKLDGFRFDTGPSLLTMPGIMHQLFDYCGQDMSNYLELVPLNPLCRYFYPDGTVFNSFEDKKKAIDEIKRIAPEDVANYQEFLSYSAELYHRTTDVFLFHPLSHFSDLLRLPIKDIFRIDAFTTVSNRVDKLVKSPYLRQFFKRFATYNGSSPYEAPATMNVIPHVELNQGGWYVKDGLYKIVWALKNLAISLGVNFKFNTIVNSIEVSDGFADGVNTSSGYFKSDIVIANSDAYETYINLMPMDALPASRRRQVEKTEPSCSGFVLMLGTNRRWDQLVHHNIYFSNDYQKEFNDIFRHKVMPNDPTIYVANTSFTDSHHAVSGGSNLFILVNAPYLNETQNWEELSNSYADFIINNLEQRGLEGLRSSVILKQTITPKDFYTKYRSNRGSIYGTSSNSRFAAFLRPRNRSPYIENLWLTGGSTHPGGGIPLCILSAFHACGIKADSSNVLPASK
jgi:phytoene desaturase